MGSSKEDPIRHRGGWESESRPASGREESETRGSRSTLEVGL